MNLHQVLTGAVNPGDSCFSVGNVGEQPFTAYASGCDIVILASDFERLQIIPGAKHGNIQVGCVDCSMQEGKIAASYGNLVCIFEPIPLLNRESKHSTLNYQWQKSGQFVLESKAHNLAWDPQGIRLLTGSNSLQLWANENQEMDINEEEATDGTDPNEVNNWQCIWESETATPIHLLKVSPDGEFFATAGKDDCLVKVWYNSSSWQSAVMTPITPMDKEEDDIDFSFVYLAHPRAVTGFSWRKTSKYLPRGSTCHVLLTCCKDNVCRLWAETLLPSDSLLSGEGYTQWSESVTASSNLKRNISSREKLNIGPFRIGRRRSSGLVAHTGYLPNQLDAHELHRNVPLHANSLCHFHIAASINPATDIPLLPSITSLSLSENEETNGPFVVHWLNNKELHFTLSMEVFLQQLRRSLEQPSPESGNEEFGQMENQSDEDKDAGEKTSSDVMVDHKIDMLLAEWNKNADMLFSIHPMDGSLLVWHVDWLDEYQPGMFRQVQISFASRIPVAFPTGDANSLSKSIVMYACTKNVDMAIQQGKQKPHGLTHSSSGMLISAGHNKSSGNLKLSIFTPNVLMISKHADGSLNQWAVSFAEESVFSTVLGVSHKSRYCGHRFHLNDLACHSVLPLLLTTSYHNALRTPDGMCLYNDGWSFDPLRCSSSWSSNQRENTTAAAFQDSNSIYSELILWRVDPVGPLSYSGGVSELARINSLHVSAFSNVAWLPTLIPSYCLGAYCNSPSACFVASDGRNLRLYQAVIDAKKLLSELSNPEISRLVGEVFSIVSQQSTARPGCIIELDAITELYGKETQLLHVFKEDFILVNQSMKRQKNERSGTNKTSPRQETEKPQNGFSEKFFLVVIEHKQNSQSLLHMWHLHLKSDPISIDHSTKNSLVPPEEQNGTSSEKIYSPFFKKYQACKANLQSASRLALISTRVYSRELPLPEGVEIIRATPSAGHLSSSSVHPACLAPYLLATSCTDGKVRFWRCRVSALPMSSAAGDGVENDLVYSWEEWPLLIEEGLQNSSAVTVPGRPVDVCCSYTNRLAVAYKKSIPVHEHSSKHFTMHVGIFECESTGASQWIHEQTIHLDDFSQTGPILDPRISIDSNLVLHNKYRLHFSNDYQMTFDAKPLVHLDWVSKEDGSHILTIGIGSKLLMYGQVSGIIQNQTKKEAPAVFSLSLWDSAKEVSQSRWILLRSLDLVSSVDGSLSLPVSLSWVRDGILVVGMDCEMHVYSQWQPPDKSDSMITEAESASIPSMVSLGKCASTNGSNQYLYKKSLAKSMTGLAQKFGGRKVPFHWNIEMEDSGLFEASHDLSPTLPQYHPLQLLELMDLGKIRRAKAILSHLVKCIAGEVITVSDTETSHERRLRSLTISASGSTARDPLTSNKSENPDYTEIDSIPPLPLCALLAADEDISHTTFEKKINCANFTKKNERHSTGNNYDELFAMSSVGADDLNSFDVDEGNKQKVIDLSQYSLTYFGPEHARVLSSHLLHSSLPGLTSMEQMFLMALADTVATISTDIGESRERTQGGETLDECGLRFLLAMRLHTFLLTSLPPVYRAQLLRQGLSTCHFAWAFHSEAEEELLNMIPAMQRGDPHWSELRSMGVGWWVRSTVILRRCIEKVAKAAFQRNNDPLDGAIFYLAMKKKAVLWGLFRSLHDKKMTEFFGKNFNDDRWRKAALKNAFALLGKQRFEQAAAFFLLAGSLKDAIEVCLERLHDIQLALVIARLYESEFEVSSTYKSILIERILGFDKKSKDFNLSLRNSDPVLRSMAYWILEDYTNSLNTLLEQGTRDVDDSDGVTVPKLSVICQSLTNLRIFKVVFACPSNIVSSEEFLSPSEDVIAAQLKFGACLKILTSELRTLSTGYEVDGGKLRYQLNKWLEREIMALQKTCNYNVAEDRKDNSEGLWDELPNEEQMENGVIDQQRTLHHQEYLQRRRLWLFQNQPLLRMFLSYCSLHGSHGGGLASVRMELILLLQESQQIHVLHTIAASLSACLYQCLCDGHSNGSLYANQFTGMVYQSFLFTRQRLNRAASLDCSVTPNTSPDQWPGIKELIQLLNSAGDEDKPKLTVLLCEVLTAIYLSLFVHGLGTHSSNELFRIVTHPLNSNMWAAIFGGGAHVPATDQIQATATTVEALEELSDPELQIDPYHFSMSEAEVVKVTGEVAPTDENHVSHFMSITPRPMIRDSETASPNHASPDVNQRIPVYKENFIPPELSIWDYFIAKPFLAPSQSKDEYDSDESQDSDDEDDAFSSDVQLQEHSNPNSFSWSLMRYAMVQLVLHKLKNFYPMAGLHLSELPVCSPSCHAILKTLQHWEQVLLRRLELFGGPPPDFISMHANEGTISSGPALLIHKVLLEPTNTPFKSKHHTALPVKRLWQYLVKQEEVQETFIRNIFTKKRCPNESVDNSNEKVRNSMTEEPSINKMETDAGYPGGRARIVHKESDIITAFAINKANRNCVAIATSHDIQELDVSAILATQIYAWIEDEFEQDSKGYEKSDEFLVVHAREDFGDLQCSTPYTPSVPGIPINMPWLGSTQTGRGASVMIKRNMNNARRMASHPTLPYYLTGAQDGSVRMFEWGHSHQLACFRPSGNSRITRIRFNHQGNKFGIVDGDGYLSFWQTNPIALGATPKPYLTWQCHNKTANDFVFVSSSTLIATAGQSSDNRNICLWDTLVPQSNSLIHAFTCHESGATVLAYASKQQLLLSGGRKGFICILDLRQRQLRQTFQAHDSPIKAIAVDPTEEYFITGSAEGNMKIWNLSTLNPIHTFSNEHARQSLFRNIGTGVMQIETGPANHIFSCGADGTMKMRILPDRFSTGSGKLDIWQNDVKFIL
ncbi:dmX-like protein 1 [Leucoraja erinacea]|uniref:dmX-like protein 1 n=1 Tax=Leucoraja erinaceus TaxID=7782 RepID=UPI0024589E60|nr:dmX-like protein 1 [Leucoraja erinacea]